MNQQTHTRLSILISSKRHQNGSQTMYKFLPLTVILLLAVFGQYVIAGGRFERTISRPFRSFLTVHNGMRWGSWGQKEMCPTGMYATGFSLKVAGMWESLLVGDNTALNGIRLHCINPSKGSSGPYEDYATVQSDVGSWGKWSDIKWCSSGFLTSFQMRVETYQGTWDDTAANNIRFNCTGNTEMLQGSGTSWGEWGDWSETCGGKGICGIETMVEQPQGVGDDTALNDVRMYCCD
ncbi:vitelline membrane outer layer 1-like protein [Labeo rohita]|uniref:Vitelline membrane outer layer 1-like protein n=1 Tax=Labeo rohita TaxID=84645 RepID=A0A498N6T4_LABRO|nr:vitelline membrane outer layer protein 1-like [Labeo rohita]RXN24615.1 vitelline membrane outer layer 1-like protein [Labeo rohita]